MKGLIIAEHNNEQLKAINYHIYTAAAQLPVVWDMMVIGCECQSVVQAAQKLSNLQKIIVADAPDYAHQLPENSAALIAEVAAEYDYVIMGATTFGKNLLPRVAALLNVAMVSDVTKILSADTFERPIYAGNAIATVQLHERIKVLTIRGTAFSATQPHAEPTDVTIQALEKVLPNTASTFIRQELTASARPELTAAQVIVAGGRGLKSAEHFKMIEALADALGGAVGASRAAVDAGFAPNDYQIGQTGKVVAPMLYIAIGISGAIQHLAGMKDSHVIVAINHDPDAPIFQVADYGLVADLFSATKELLAALRHKDTENG